MPRLTTKQLVEIHRYYTDKSFREAMRCSECGNRGGCTHFLKEASNNARG